jgi:hypothetical protein
MNSPQDIVFLKMALVYKLKTANYSIEQIFLIIKATGVVVTIIAEIDNLFNADLAARIVESTLWTHITELDWFTNILRDEDRDEILAVRFNIFYCFYLPYRITVLF